MITSNAVRPVYPKDFAGVFRLLQRLDPRRTAEQWRPIFDFPWRRDDEPVGYAVYDSAEAVGYIGTILSEMAVDGRVERFCNITSWVTLDAHRGAGALLVLPLRQLRDHTVTSMTSNPEAARVLDRLGFEVLDAEWTILRPAIGLRSLERATSVRILTNPLEIEPLLSPPDARILADHRHRAFHLLAVAENGYCYLVYSMRTRMCIRTAHFQHVSDPQLFRRFWSRIHQSLLVHRGALLGEADSRLLSGVDIPGSFRKRMGDPRLFKSNRLRAEQVPNLYSELILLDLQ
jgi:hypothetical protein